MSNANLQCAGSPGLSPSPMSYALEQANQPMESEMYFRIVMIIIAMNCGKEKNWSMQPREFLTKIGRNVLHMHHLASYIE